MDATLVIYTGADTPNIPLPANTNLEVALQLIDAALAAGSSAPDYSGYSLACVTQTDGSSHPTNTQNFAEGISKILCDLKTAYTTFTGTTYVTDKSTFTTAITNLQAPGYTYVPFSILNTDGINTVWSKVFTGLTAMTNSINPSSADWSDIGASAQSTIVNAFNTIIAYELTQDTEIAGKEDSLGTFDTTNIGGASGTDAADAIGEIITWVEALPTLDPGDITSTCVATGTDLTEWLQNTINTVDNISANYVATNGTGLVLGSSSGCNGKALSVDLDYAPLYKVRVNGLDTEDYLIDKIESSDGSIDISDNSGTLDIKVSTAPDLGKVKVNSSDTDLDYIANKIIPMSSPWGISLTIAPNATNDKLVITPAIDMETLWSTLADWISTDQDALSRLCQLNAQCTGCCSCAAPTNLTVTRTNS